ncbi:hypothetical protein VaNZ11_011960 [Volvox africanus]|uniref:Glycosyltransferase n=1 Tax=Volvox africanus TaxID=51714 RepID=A0ABQ5SD32_9CHLO|nr:hypothetical protein VaNZ11_011960 [Volvox africanus]
MARSGQRPAAGRRGGVALGVLGIMLLAFFAIVFMLGRPGYWKSFNDLVHHPFDPHPIGIDKRHKENPIAQSSGGTGEQASPIIVTKTQEEVVVEVVVAPSPSPPPPLSPKAPPVPVQSVSSKANESTKNANVAITLANQGGIQAATEDTKPGLEGKPTSEIKEGSKEVSKQEVAAEAAKESAEKPTNQEGKTDGEDDDGGLTKLDNEYKPTREMVQRIAQNGYLVVTWANYHYFDFVRTWVDHVVSVGVTGYIVGAMDDHLLREMIALKYNCFSMKSGLTLGDFGWGSPTFAKMGREKIRLISIFLNLDVSVVIADVDVLWLRNPLPYFDRYPEADILTSSDSTFATVPDEQLERWPEAGAAANIGIMLFRKKSLSFVEDWIQVIESDDKIWDQNAFNDLFRRGWKTLEPANKNLFLGYDGSLTMGILPVSLFCSGHTMFVQRLGYTLGLQPYAVHATFQFSGTPGKRHRMREFQMYSDPPEYYDHTVGFVSFDFDGLQELLETAGPATDKMDLANVQGHFKLVNHQLLRLRTAFAISSVVLHRALVMPPLWCGLDRWWAPHAGRIPGATFKLPFQCPLDHVLDLENGVFKTLPDDHYGPRTEIREYTFFNNSKMTPRVRDDRVVVELCSPGAADCSDGREPAKLQIDGGVAKVRVQAGLPSAQLEAALSAVKGTKVLHFTTMANAMGDFSESAVATRFISRMKLYGSIWCCVLAHPGHIHYDLLWDVPHVDKFMRPWNGTWNTVTGP